MMASQPPPEAISLNDPPSDGITSLTYLPGEPDCLLGSTSWDGSVRVHNTLTKAAVLSHAMDSGPLLSLAKRGDAESVVTGGLDGSVRLLNIPTTTPQIIGRQDGSGIESKDPCSCLASLDGDNSNLIASAGWSKKFYLWDIRQPSPVTTIKLPGKAFDMDYDKAHNRLVIATSGRRTCFIDMKSSEKAEMVLERESSLKFQTRCVRFFPDGNGIALGSVEGRVGVEFLDELGVQSSMKKYAFKCHRVNDTVYPVNCIEFHPRFIGTFATGGCDGGVVLWDGNHKKKLTSLPSFPTSISALAFNHDGSELAIASSYTYEEGDREHPKDEIFIRKILDSECLPKPK